ncbi:hypothetical protein nbrc107696_39610 [Gordonia spumicola]|uniref:Uncharacterized protein n=1 Tax=Gordonia spumicola TaxID=589161 RepID=A0A7I9VDZ4_9ACTN|nr:hypothetical protein [Gordonia spumicola]GEE03515.1 hypothetical protein nbrc107696_39610 [Gordonia spumicola]
MDFQHIDDAIAEVDLDTVVGWISTLDDDDRATAGRWYRKSGRTAARRRFEDLQFGVAWPGARTVQLVLASGLSATPADAVTACRFTRSWVSECGLAAPVAEAVIARGEAWATEFVARTTALAFNDPERGNRREAAQIISGVVEWFGLPLPSAPLYVEGWAAALTHAKHRLSGTWGRDADPPVGLLSVVDGRLRSVHLSSRPDLVGLLRSTPRLPEMLLAAAAHPGTFTGLTSSPREGWRLDEAIAAILADGGVDRSAVVAAALGALAQPQPPYGQRASAAILAGCSFGPGDVAAHEPEVIGLLSTVHAYALPVLAAAATAADLTPEALFDTASVLLVRKEKGPKKALVDRLLARSAESRDLLELAADNVDGALRGRVLAALGGAAPKDDPADIGGWLPATHSRDAGPLEPVTADVEGLTALTAETDVYASITDESRTLDAVSRLLERGRSHAESVLAQLPAAGEYGNQTRYVTDQWLADGIVTHSATWRSSAYQFTTRLIDETLTRGTRPVSTSTRTDGTLTLDDLRDRLTSEPIGPYDFVQALLRLRPGDTGAVRLHVDGVPNAADLLRRWVDGGGTARWRASGQSIAAYLQLPPHVAGLPRLGAVGLDAHKVPDYELIPYLGVLPFDGDALAAPDGRSGMAVNRLLPHLAAAPGVDGHGVLPLILSHVNHTRADCRLRAGEALIEMYRVGRLDPAALAPIVTARAAGRSLALSRFAHVADDVARADALGIVWPAWSALLDWACGVPRKPAGLSTLLASLGPHLPTVVANVGPSPLPDAVRALARAAGSTAAVAEARTLVAAEGK